MFNKTQLYLLVEFSGSFLLEIETLKKETYIECRQRPHCLKAQFVLLIKSHTQLFGDISQPISLLSTSNCSSLYEPQDLGLHKEAGIDHQDKKRKYLFFLQ